jgi:hypothetical protein
MGRGLPSDLESAGSRSGLEDEAYALFWGVPEGFDVVQLCGLELEMDGIFGGEREELCDGLMDLIERVAP